MISRSFADLVSSTGVANATPGNLVMILVGCALLYLAIVKKFEPLLLLPIGIGAILTNIPVSGIFHSEIWLGPAGLGPGEWGSPTSSKPWWSTVGWWTGCTWGSNSVSSPRLSSGAWVPCLILVPLSPIPS